MVVIGFIVNAIMVPILLTSSNKDPYGGEAFSHFAMDGGLAFFLSPYGFHLLHCYSVWG